ncbi:MAG TPA: hypothetical protein VFF81_09195 [Noviherbaspirillum sp.]|nr:hypothetical protein [Noviherbaspirillum sp.]
MKTTTIVLLAALALAACGGSDKGDDQPTQVQGATTTAPAVPSNATVVGGNYLTMNTNGNNYLVQFNGTANITLPASSNNVWIARNQAVGSFYLSGSGNTVVFLPGSTAMSFDVTGANNTIYIPAGSTVVAIGGNANGNNVITYTP